MSHPKYDYMVGTLYGRLKVLEVQSRYDFAKKAMPCAYVRCSCGVEKWTPVYRLLDGIKSCGCYQREVFADIGRKSAHKRIIHGMSSSPEYNAWHCMISRCTTKSDRRYKDYGGRGIKVCERWSKFAEFYTDMGCRPSSNHSLERLDNNGDYSKSNCKWGTVEEQSNNKRGSLKLCLDGRTKTITQWAAELRVNEFRMRLLGLRLICRLSTSGLKLSATDLEEVK